MSIRLNPSCCGCSPPFPAWTVYHENVNSKLHYYVARFYTSGSFAHKYLMMFYEGTSGGYLVYKNCSTSSGIYTWEYDSSAVSRLYLEQTDFIPTGISSSNPWIKAARIEKFEVSGRYLDNDILATGYININSVLQYESGQPYTMGMNYCGINSGISGSLGLPSGNISSFSLFPFIGGKLVVSNNGILSQIATNSDNFTEYNGYNDCTNCGRLWEDSFNISGACLVPPFYMGFTASGTAHYSSGVTSASRTQLFSGGCNCISPAGFFPLVQALYSFNFYNAVEGTSLSLQTYSYPLELHEYSPNTLCTNRSNWFPLFGFEPYERTYPSGYSCFAGPFLNGTFGASGVSSPFVPCDTVDYGGNGGYIVNTSLCTRLFPTPSGGYVCISGNSPPSGYSYLPINPISYIAPMKPVLAILKRGTYDFTQQVLRDAVLAEQFCGYTLEPTGVILYHNYTIDPFISVLQENDQITNTLNYDLSISIFNPLSDKHILEDFNDESFFEPQSLTPWVGFSSSEDIGIFDFATLTCCPTTEGSYSTSWSSSNSGSLGSYSYGCPPTVTNDFWAFTPVCNSNMNITTSNMSFTNTQLSIPESESCL